MTSRTKLGVLLAIACAPFAWWGTACGGSSDDNGNGGGDAGSDGTGGGDATDDQVSFFDANGCTSGKSCGDGGVCAGNTCCAADKACGDVCCGGAQLCSFQKCVTPGVVCTDSTDCASGEYCEYALGNQAPDAGVLDAGSADGGDAGQCTSGKAVQQGRCLPRPPICAGDAGAPTDGGAITCLEKCEYKPATTAFDPVVKYAWGGQITPPYSSDVMMAPIVIELDDDNCDGKVTSDDIPEIVFSTFTGGAYFKQGSLHSISIVGGQVVDKWTRANVTQPGGGLAAGDLDGDGVPEIVGCADPGPSGASCCDALAQNTGAVAFRANGADYWSQLDTTKVHCGYEAPAIGDVDNDGFPEVLIGWTILDGRTGAVKKELDPASTFGAKLTSLVDLDADGKLDVTDGQRAYKADGTRLWDLRSGVDAIPFGYHAVGDFDHNGVPEVVVISSGGPHTMSLVRYNSQKPSGADVIRRGIDINNGTSTATFCNAGSEYGGGPPTVADFDGDGMPDVGAAGAVGYVVFSGARMMNAVIPDNQLVLWFKTTHDCSSAVTGSSVFDFNGDGKAEVVYSDEYHLWMYDGRTGNNLIPSTCNTTGTLWEYPLVADVDNDGQADIVVASNAYAITCPDDASKQSGIRVFGSASKSWVRTRRVWNEHTYHITNVAENGAIPKNEPRNWLQPGLDDFRLNKQPGSEFAAPDGVVSMRPVCIGGRYSLVATVRNLGEAVLPAGVLVSFFKGDPPTGTLLGQSATTHALSPAGSEDVTLVVANPTADLTSGQAHVYATITPPATTHECNANNDTSPPVSSGCQQVR